jgi:hypothetical protein
MKYLPEIIFSIFAVLAVTIPIPFMWLFWFSMGVTIVSNFALIFNLDLIYELNDPGLCRRSNILAFIGVFILLWVSGWIVTSTLIAIRILTDIELMFSYKKLKKPLD